MLPDMRVGQSGWSKRVVALCLGAACASGCAYGELRQVLRAQVSAELHCPAVAVSTRKWYDAGYKENQYEVRGCGVSRTYACPPSDGLVSYDDKPCTIVVGASPAPAATKPAASDDAANAP